MANNFFGKLRGLVSTAWSEPDTEPTHNAPSPAQSAGKPSSVERYLAKQAAAQAVTEGKALTGVEKYMARIAGATQAAEVSTGPLTSVDKYLARQAGTLKAEPAKPAAPLSKVDKYLASHPAPTKEKVAPAKKAEETVKEAPAAKKKKMK
jgi:hypothetical protein